MRGKAGAKRKNWLLIKSRDDDARARDAPDILEEQPQSVTTNRTIEEVTDGKAARKRSAKAGAKARDKPAEKAGATEPRQASGGGSDGAPARAPKPPGW